jgi:hypothetical protein
MLRSVPFRHPLLVGFVLGMALTACSYFPRTLEGLPDGPAWTSLPLTDWLAEDRAEPEAVALCEECGSGGMAAGVVRLFGASAQEAEAVLRAPQGLARTLEAKSRERRDPKAKFKAKPVPVKVSTRPLGAAGSSGFLLTLTREDGAKPPVYGAALGQREKEALAVILVIGTDAEAVESIARRIAVEHLGP